MLRRFETRIRSMGERSRMVRDHDSRNFRGGRRARMFLEFRRHASESTFPWKRRGRKGQNPVAEGADFRTSVFRKGDGDGAETRGGTCAARTISFESDSTLYAKEVARYSERKEEISEDGTTPSLLRLVQSSSFALSNV